MTHYTFESIAQNAYVQMRARSHKEAVKMVRGQGLDPKRGVLRANGRRVEVA